MSEMKIQNYQTCLTSQSIAATFDLYFPASGCTYRNFKLIRTKNGSHFAAPPSFAQQQPDGSKKYIPYIEFDGEKNAAFFRKILDTLGEDGLI